MALLNDGDIIFRVQLLLDIVHKSSSGGPAYGKWAQAAQEELDDIWQTINGVAELELPLEDHDHE